MMPKQPSLNNSPVGIDIIVCLKIFYDGVENDCSFSLYIFVVLFFIFSMLALLYMHSVLFADLRRGGGHTLVSMNIAHGRLYQECVYIY